MERLQSHHRSVLRNTSDSGFAGLQFFHLLGVFRIGYELGSEVQNGTLLLLVDRQANDHLFCTFDPFLHLSDHLFRRRASRFRIVFIEVRALRRHSLFHSRLHLSDDEIDDLFRNVLRIDLNANVVLLDHLDEDITHVCGDIRQCIFRLSDIKPFANLFGVNCIISDTKFIKSITQIVGLTNHGAQLVKELL